MPTIQQFLGQRRTIERTFFGLRACPDVHKVGVAYVTHRFLPISAFQAIARIYLAVRVDEEVHAAGFARQRTAATVDIIDKPHVEERTEPALGVIFLELPVDERLEVGAYLLAIGNLVVALVEIVRIVESRSDKFHTERFRELIER